MQWNKLEATGGEGRHVFQISIFCYREIFGVISDIHKDKAIICNNHEPQAIMFICDAQLT